MNLRLGHSLQSLRPTRHNGPGARVSFWVQGCVHRCTERCLNPQFLDPAGGYEYPVEAVAAAILAVAAAAPDPVAGVTVLGGEPFEQAAAVAELLAPLRRAGLSAMVYTGHTVEGLRRRGAADIDALLGETDVLADGPFLPHLYDERLAWRGSRNQRLLCLTERHTPAELDAAFAAQGKGYSIQVGGGRVSASGLQTPAGAAEVTEILGLGNRTRGANPTPSPSTNETRADA